MAGRPKQGIDYSGWSVDMFDSDTKIDKLIDSKGWIGFGIYFYLCQKAYQSTGYYYTWSYDDCATTARKMGGGISSGTVRETVSYCCQIDLFDERLFGGWGVLTSRGIQRRYWSVLQERRCKTVYTEFWLLGDDECKGLVKVSLKSNNTPTNSYLQDANDDLPRIKQSKVKESKKDIYCASQMHDGQKLDEFFESIWKLYPIKKGKGQVSKTKKQVLYRIGFDQIKRCVERFIADMESEHRDKKYWMHGSTFFNSGYVDYLDKNFSSSEVQTTKEMVADPEDEELVGDDW